MPITPPVDGLPLTHSPDPPHLGAGAGTAAQQSTGLRMLADYESGGWSFEPGPDMILNGHFTDDVSYWAQAGTTSFTVVGGAAHIDIPVTAAPADVLIATNAPADSAGTYRLTFDASINPPQQISVIYPSPQTVNVSDVFATHTVDFVLTAPEPAGQLQFWLGGAAAPAHMTLDNVTLHRVA